MAVKYELTLSHHVVVMSLEVEGQVVRPGEGPVTHPTLEGPIARVFAHVPGQLVGAGEAPVAPGPRAQVRLLAWNNKEGNIIFMAYKGCMGQHQQMTYPFRYPSTRGRGSFAFLATTRAA